MSAAKIDEYESYDAIGLAELVRSGDATPEELLDAALERMQRHNPAINAVVIPMIEQAQTAIADGLPDGPFRGVPFLLKDLHAFYAGVPTTNGSRLFESFVPDHDTELVARYRRAGLVVFGKSASPEMGITATTESRLYGATRNPWNLEHSAGGSSGGAAAAVAAGILPAANASDGGGSIRIPASCCGLFGMKPTRARNPAGPDVGEGWAGMSTAHVVSRSVRDSAALLDATEGPDLGAPYWAPPPARPYLQEVGAEPGRLRITLQTRAFNGAETHPDCIAGARAAAKLCESLGHEVEERDLPIDFGPVRDAAQTIIAANLRASLELRAEALGRAIGEDDIEPITSAMIKNVQASSASDYARAIPVIHAAGRRVERFLHDFDVLLTPTMAAPPARIGALALDNPDFGSFVGHVSAAVGFTQIFNVSGHPAMSVPLAWSSEGGLPIGIQFAGRFGDEACLYRLAAQLEQAQPWFERRPQ